MSDVVVEMEPYVWSEPEELSLIGKHINYPVGSFPDVVGEAILEVTEHGKMPTAIAAGSALSALSVAIQSLVDVARDSRLISPCSLNLLVVAVSGERKSTADRIIAAPMKEWEVSKRKEMEPEVQEARAKYSAWQAKVDGAKNAIKYTQTKGPKMKDGVRIGPSLSNLEADLIQLEKNPVERPIELHLFHEDTTAEGLAWHVATGWPSQALWSDEGALVVGGQGMRRESLLGFLGLLNRLWDGQPFKPTRKVADTAEIRGKRFTSNLMVQPEVLHSLTGTGPSRGVGFFARYLVAYPQSTMGNRMYSAPVGELEAVPVFGRRLQELLDLVPVKDEFGNLSPTVIHLSDEARGVWAKFHDAVEAGMRTYGEFADIRDIASKIADNAARVACLFHVYENGVSGSIDEDTMARAVSVAAWYLNESKRTFGELAEPENAANARALSKWLADGAGGHLKNGEIKANTILQHGPRAVRNKQERNEALELLTDLNHIRREQGVKGTVIVQVNPSLVAK
jgi:hypothetical protein